MGYIPMMYLKARYILADRDTSFMFSVFMTNLVDMMVYIQQNWEMLVEDIRTGGFNADVEIDPETRAELMKVTKPMPERAAELEKVFREGFDTPIPIDKDGKYGKLMEKILCEVNPEYQAVVDCGDLDVPLVLIQQQQTHMLWREMKLHKGSSANQVKPVRVLDVPMKQKFFFGLLEDGQEVPNWNVFQKKK